MKASLLKKRSPSLLRAGRYSALNRLPKRYFLGWSRAAYHIAVLFAYLLFAIISGALFDCNCSNNNPVAGTIDDTNSGTLLGKLLTDGKTIDDTVTVSLFNEDTSTGLAKAGSKKKDPKRTLVSCNGTYEFDSLAAGIYRIEVAKDSIIVGQKHGIKLDRNERKEVNITIIIIINQTFNIWTDQSQNITINNFYIDNGKVEKADSGYVLSFAKADTIFFRIEIAKDGTTSIVRARVLRHSDGTTTFEIIDATVDVIITPGPGPATGYLGDVSIGIKEPGTVKVESSFDTSGVPRKSE